MSDKSYKKQVIDYLKRNLKKGYTKESLKWALVNQGHSKLEVQDAFQKLEQELAKEAPVLKTKPQIKYEIITSSPNILKQKKKFFWN